MNTTTQIDLQCQGCHSASSGEGAPTKFHNLSTPVIKGGNRQISNPENVKSNKSYPVQLSIRHSIDMIGKAIDNYLHSTPTVVLS
jgi:hypothetical protein